MEVFVASVLNFFRIEAAAFVEVRKMALIR